MKLRHFLLLVPLLLVTLGLTAHAQTPLEGAPKLIDYQGLALDSNGNPLAPATPTNYTMKFRLYSTQSGGTAIWSEQQTVTVSDGQFSVRLGQGIAIGADPRPDLSTVFTGKDRFLGLTIVIPPQAEGEITPRLAFLSAPFSFVSERARTADSVMGTGASTLGTATIANFTLAGSGRVNGANFLEFGSGVSGKQSDAGKIGYETFTAGTLDIVGAGTTGTDRKVKIFSEGGLTVSGPLSLTTTTNLAASISSSSTVGTWLNLQNTSVGGTNWQLVSTGSANGGGAGILQLGTGTVPGSSGGVLFLNTNGRVGVGVNLPAFRLHVQDPGANTGRLHIGSRTSGGDSKLISFGDGDFVYLGENGTDDTMELRATRFFFNAGNVGIGTNSPPERLAVGSFGEGRDNYISVDTGGGNLQRAGIRLRHFDANNGFTIESDERAAGAFGLNFIENPGISRMVIRKGGNVGIATQNPPFTLTVNGSAGKPGGGSWSVFSDERLKKAIIPLSGALDKLLALRGVTFEYRDAAAINEMEGRQIGMIAQEVEKVFPDWVDQGADGMKRVSVRGFEALTVEALRELSSEKDRKIGALENEIAALKAEREKDRRATAQRLTDMETTLRKVNALLESSAKPEIRNVSFDR